MWYDFDVTTGRWNVGIGDVVVKDFAHQDDAIDFIGTYHRASMLNKNQIEVIECVM